LDRDDRERAPDAEPAPDHRALGLRDGLPGLCDLMERLLDGCPWDREQTLETLRPYLLEETHEVLDAMEDPVAHRLELGDLLFQIVFQAALRHREGHFDMDGVIEGIRSKLIRRHPHVFGDEKATSAEEVAVRWRELKARERPRESPLEGVPKSMPALERAARIQARAAAVGFDWPDVAGPRDKLNEELAELDAAIATRDREAIEQELGDLLFVIVRLAQKLDVSPEFALRGAIAKFDRRFAHVMRRCREEGIAPESAGLARLDEFWNEAKLSTRPSGPDSSAE
jgi:MazG family protein